MPNISSSGESSLHETPYDAVVVGAGPAGVAVGAALDAVDVEFVVVDRAEIGASLRSWPAETRLLTPSFASNSFGQVDLNAVAPRTSPAFSLGREHPTGDRYADYLEGVVDLYDIPVETGTEVTGIARVDDDTAAGTSAPTSDDGVAVDGGTSTADSGGATDAPFELRTSAGPIVADNVVWAGGEFGTPRRHAFSGAEHGVHYADVSSWADFAAEHGLADEPDSEEAGHGAIIVGGFESGVDAAVGLVNAGASVTLIDSGDPWNYTHPDPSEALSPFTRERLDEALETDRLDLRSETEVISAARDGETYTVSTLDGEELQSAAPPVLATGFEPNLGPVADRFEDGDRGFPALTDRDESTTTHGLFLAGPAVTHEGIRFCFIYKFRQRAPVIAAEIAERCGGDPDELDAWREEDMYLEDLSCCEPDVCDC